MAKIFIIEDEKELAELVRDYLVQSNYEVEIFNDGQTGLQAALQDNPDLIILDLGLPGMSGFEVARRIRESTELVNVRLAALTGWGQEEDRRRTHESGFDHHLTKPVDIAALQALLANL